MTPSKLGRSLMNCLVACRLTDGYMDSCSGQQVRVVQCLFTKFSTFCPHIEVFFGFYFMKLCLKCLARDC